jgi:hypothetical protein
MIAANRRANADVTATEKLLDSIQETSALQVQAMQLQDALELALGFTAQYLGLGADKGGSLELGATWTEMVIDPQELTALSGLVDLGQMSLESFLWTLEKTGKLPPDKTAEDEKKAIDEEQAQQAKLEPVMQAVAMPNPQQMGNTPQPNGNQQNPPVPKAA